VLSRWTGRASRKARIGLIVLSGGTEPLSAYAKLLRMMSLANAYRALGDPTRREILRLLREGDLAAGELAGRFEISWPSVSRHLKVLEGAGLVSSARRGGNIIYSLQTSVLEDIATEIADMAGIGQPARSTTSLTRARRPARPKRA
jgi:ArsR family transcriptional regulator